MLQHIIHKLFSIEKDEVASDATNPSRRTTPNVDSFPMMSRRTCESPIAAAEPQQASRTSSYLFCRHPWLLAWPRATNLGLSAARPPTLRVCARAVRATRSPRAHGSLPYGQPSAPVGLRIRAYGSPLARSASGRVLSPPYAAVRPNARSTGARGQRASRPASGAHPTRGRPVCCRHVLVRARPVHQPARAAKAHCSGNPAATARHRQPSPSRSTSSRHPVAPTRSHSRAATAPLATPVAPASTREHLRAPGVPPAHPHGRKPTRAPTDRRRS